MKKPVQPQKVRRKLAQSQMKQISADQQPKTTSEQMSRAPTPFIQPRSAPILAKVEERSLAEFDRDSFMGGAFGSNHHLVQVQPFTSRCAFPYHKVDEYYL